MGKRKKTGKKNVQSPPSKPKRAFSQQESFQTSEKREEEASINQHSQESVVATDDPQESSFYSALGHDIRRQILRLIGSGENVGFSNIKNETKMSTGTIYHHLEVLSDLIHQNLKKKYQLTELGEKAYLFLTQNQGTGDLPQRLLPPKFRKAIFLTPLSNLMTKSPKWARIFTFGLVITIGLLCALFEIPAYLFYFSSQPMPDLFINGNFWLIRFGIFLSVLAGFGIITLLVEILVRFLYHRNIVGAKLLNVMGIPYLPILFYVSLIVGMKSLSTLPSWLTILINILFISLQIWAMILLASIISIIKEVNYERGLLIAIFINYGTFLILLVTNTPIFA